MAITEMTYSTALQPSGACLMAKLATAQHAEPTGAAVLSQVKTLPARLYGEGIWRRDLFNRDMPLASIQRMFDRMRETPRHRYKVLTNTSERLLALSGQIAWPSNVWMGVRVESANDLKRADHLRKTGAKVKVLSLERQRGSLGTLNLQGIGWVTLSGETGRDGRPMDQKWARSVKDQCKAAGVPFCFEGWGEWLPACQDGAMGWLLTSKPEEQPRYTRWPVYMNGMDKPWRCGRKKAGALLDGDEYEELPNA